MNYVKKYAGVVASGFIFIKTLSHIKDDHLTFGYYFMASFMFVTFLAFVYQAFFHKK